MGFEVYAFPSLFGKKIRAFLNFLGSLDASKSNKHPKTPGISVAYLQEPLIPCKAHGFQRNCRIHCGQKLGGTFGYPISDLVTFPWFNTTLFAKKMTCKP